MAGETSCNGGSASTVCGNGNGIMRKWALGDRGGVGGRGCKPVSAAPEEETETEGKSTMLFFRIRGGCVVASGMDVRSNCDDEALPTGVIERR